MLPLPYSCLPSPLHRILPNLPLPISSSSQERIILVWKMNPTLLHLNLHLSLTPSLHRRRRRERTRSILKRKWRRGYRVWDRLMECIHFIRKMNVLCRCVVCTIWARVRPRRWSPSVLTLTPSTSWPNDFLLLANTQSFFNCTQASTHVLNYEFTSPSLHQSRGPRDAESFGLDTRGRLMFLPMDHFKGMVRRMGEVYA